MSYAKGAPDELDAKKASHSSMNYTIQVASYPDQNPADSLSDSFTKKGQVSFVSKSRIGTSDWYRVNVGHYQTRKTASIFLREKLKDRPGAFVVQMGKSERIPASTTAAKPALPKLVPVPAITTVPPEPGEPEADLEKSRGLFGDWRGVKSGLERRGVDIFLRYKADFVNNLSGGIEKRKTNLGNLDLTLDFDLEKTAGLKNLSLFLYGLGNHGGKPTEFIGDSFASSNIQAPATFKLYEAYFKKTIDANFTILLGLRDLNADFYATESSGGFINSAFGISPSLSQTGVNGPSIFPWAAPALSFKYSSPETFYFQSAVFNAIAGDPANLEGTHIPTITDEGYLMIWEFGFAKSEKDNYFKQSLGAWTYTKPKSALDATLGEKLNAGIYFLLEKNAGEHFKFFLRHGVATPQVNKFRASTEVGTVFADFWTQRPNDKINFGVALGSVSSDFQTINDSTSSETVYELNYQFNFDSGLTITPDFQIIKSPGTLKTLSDAQVATLRFSIEF